MLGWTLWRHCTAKPIVQLAIIANTSGFLHQACFNPGTNQVWVGCTTHWGSVIPLVILWSNPLGRKLWACGHNTKSFAYSCKSTQLQHWSVWLSSLHVFLPGISLCGNWLDKLMLIQNTYDNICVVSKLLHIILKNIHLESRKTVLIICCQMFFLIE